MIMTGQGHFVTANGFTAVSEVVNLDIMTQFFKTILCKNFVAMTFAG